MALLTLRQLERHLAGAADILRGPSGGRDALDTIAVLLLLKHCSDQADAGENTEGLRVPGPARWEQLRARIGNQDGNGMITAALRAVEAANPAAAGLAAHPGAALADALPAATLGRLAAHLDRCRLRRSDLEFPDLPGAAYERLLSELSVRGGTGAEYYTPPGVAALLATIAGPAAGARVYDPCCGSGGLLVAAAAHAPGISLYGQDVSQQAVTAARVNMILHGAGTADLRCGDVLAAPGHLDPDGGLQRFSAVIANPPFARGYRQADLAFPGRFAWGHAPETGRKADWMFAQHAAAVLEPVGRAVVIMPHGVLFRGGKEKAIRRRILEDGRVDAVIGLAPGLFHGTGIPACILVLNGGTPRTPGTVLFIDASREYEPGRAQNGLRPRHIGKIATAFADAADVPGFARTVPLAALKDSDWNLNIGLHVDSFQPPEPQDVRAHLHGGMPETEIRAHEAVFEACGINVRDLFGPPATGTGPGYLTFPDTWKQVPDQIAGLAAPQKDRLLKAAAEWCRAALRDTGLRDASPQDLPAARSRLLESFTAEPVLLSALDRLTLAGVLWSWWEDILPDLRVIAAAGHAELPRHWGGLLDDRRPGELPPLAAVALRALAPAQAARLENTPGTGRAGKAEARQTAQALKDAAVRAGPEQARAAMEEAFQHRLEYHLGAAFDSGTRTAAERYRIWTGKYAVSLREMQAACEQSRARFWSLMNLLYPPPGDETDRSRHRDGH